MDDPILELSVLDEGQGEPVLLLHAFPLNRAMWAPQVEALRRDFRVLAPELPGFGATPPAAGPVTMDGLADALAGLLEARGCQRVVVCGCSMGGYLAFAFIRRHRERVRALVLANTRAEADTEQGRRARLEMAALARREGPAPVAERMLPRLLGRTSHAERPAVVAAVRGWIMQATGEGIAAAQEAMASRPDSRPLLAGITCPTLVIAGEEDEIIPPTVGEELARDVRGAFRRLPRTGHLANVEEPESFNRALGEFLEGAALAGS